MKNKIRSVLLLTFVVLLFLSCNKNKDEFDKIIKEVEEPVVVTEEETPKMTTKVTTWPQSDDGTCA